MAWLAWLMLVLTPLHAAPSAAMDPMHAAAGAAHAMATHAMASQAMAMVGLGSAHGAACCCNGPGQQGCGSIGVCHCAAGGGNTLPIAAMPELAPPKLDAVYASARRVTPPGRIHAPPLRPPARRLIPPCKSLAFIDIA